MNSFDHELKNALRREEPSADFAARVMARIQTVPATRPGWREALAQMFRFPALRWATAAAMCCALVISVIAYQRYRTRQAEGELARAKVMLALRIASSKLNVAFREVQRADQPPRAGTVPKSERKMEHL